MSCWAGDLRKCSVELTGCNLTVGWARPNATLPSEVWQSGTRGVLSPIANVVAPDPESFAHGRGSVGGVADRRLISVEDPKRCHRSIQPSRILAEPLPWLRR